MGAAGAENAYSATQTWPPDTQCAVRRPCSDAEVCRSQFESLLMPFLRPDTGSRYSPVLNHLLNGSCIHVRMIDGKVTVPEFLQTVQRAGRARFADDFR